MNIATALRTPGWMTEDELTWLAMQARDAAVIVEVGAWKGRSTIAMAEHSEGRIYAVDHWRGSDKEHLHEIERRGPDSVFDDFRANLAPWIADGRVRTLRMDSLDAARLLAQVEGFVDFVFIDADHSYEGVARDIAAYRNLVWRGGIIAGHDYGNPEFPGVVRAVHEAFQNVNKAAYSIWWVQL